MEKLNNFKLSVLYFILFSLFLSNYSTAQSFLTVIPDKNANLNSVQTQKLSALRNQARYSTVKCIRIGSIPDLQHNGSLTFTMPASANELVAEAYRIESYDVDSFVWYTKFKVPYIDENEEEQTGYDGGMIIHRNGENYHGQIQLPESGNIFEIWSLGGGKHILATWDMDASEDYECKTTAYESDPGSPPAGGPCVPIVKVLVCYTQNAKNSVANIDQLIDQIFIYQNGAVYNSAGSTQNLSFQLAAKQQISFTESGDMSDDLNDLSIDATVQTLRNNNKADIVVLLTGNSYPGAIGEVKEINASLNDAFAIVAAPEAIGGNFVFMHEVGHLFGARHQQSSLCNANPDDNAGQHGFKFNTGVFGITQRKTIMANRYFSCGTKSKEHYYSTPNKKIMGKTIGSNPANNVTQLMLDNACRFASYYQESGSNGGVSVTINGPLQANAYDNVNFTAVTQGIPSPVYSWSISYEGFSYYGTGGNSVALSEYMNDEDHLWVKVTASGGGLSASDFHKVQNIDNPYRPAPPQTKPEDNELQQVDKHHLKIYPNPAKQELNLYFTSETNDHIEVSVFDVYGRVLLTRTYKVTAHSLNTPKLLIEGLASGSYFLTFKSAQYEARKLFTIIP